MSCRACGSDNSRAFHRQDRIPTNSCLLLDSLDEAAGYPKGDLQLMFCEDCGFIWNDVFDAELSEYSARYEETQGFSARFVDFAKALAREWVDDYDLAGKTVLEIGCGKGEFLQWMVEAGAGRGIGIDPSAHPERIDPAVADRLEWLIEKYSYDRHSTIEADAIVCRHTLEHIAPVEEFMRTLRRTIGDRLDTVVLFELPDVQRVLDEAAFWDVYYEHCSYFSPGSLTRLFERTGFQVEKLSLDYDDQYILIVARPVAEVTAFVDELSDDMDVLRRGVDHFEHSYTETIGRWSRDLGAVRERGGEAVVWGAGSKGVAFLTSLPNSSELVQCAVDINPFKSGKYMAGSGHQTVLPAALVDVQPEFVVVMNPIYTDEVRESLRELGLTPTVAAV